MMDGKCLIHEILSRKSVLERRVINDEEKQVIGKIRQISSQCETRHCSHTNEKGCAVRQAVASGEIAQRDLDQFKRLTGR